MSRRRIGNAPCSSTLCLWPGAVRSATVLLIMVMKFAYSFRVKREKSLSSCAAHSCTAGFLELSRTWRRVSRQSPPPFLTVSPGEKTYANVIELHLVGVVLGLSRQDP